MSPASAMSCSGRLALGSNRPARPGQQSALRRAASSQGRQRASTVPRAQQPVPFGAAPTPPASSAAADLFSSAPRLPDLQLPDGVQLPQLDVQQIDVQQAAAAAAQVGCCGRRCGVAVVRCSGGCRAQHAAPSPHRRQRPRRRRRPSRRSMCSTAGPSTCCSGAPWACLATRSSCWRRGNEDSCSLLPASRPSPPSRVNSCLHRV